MFDDSCNAEFHEGGNVVSILNMQQQNDHASDVIPVSLDILSNCDTNSSITNSTSVKRVTVKASSFCSSTHGFIPFEHGVAFNEETVSNVSTEFVNLEGLRILDELNLHTDRVSVTAQKKIHKTPRRKVTIARCLQCGRFCPRNVSCPKCTNDLHSSRISNLSD